MIPAYSRRFTGVLAFSFSCVLFITSCDRTSSPEGRMSIKLENLQKEMVDSLQEQNKAILDSIGNIREELSEIRQKIK